MYAQIKKPKNHKKRQWFPSIKNKSVLQLGGVNSKIKENDDSLLIDWPAGYNKPTAEEINRGIAINEKLNLGKLEECPYITKEALEAIKDGKGHQETMYMADNKWELISFENKSTNKYQNNGLEIWYHTEEHIVTFNALGPAANRIMQKGVKYLTNKFEGSNLNEKDVMHLSTHNKEANLQNGHQHIVTNLPIDINALKDYIQTLYS